MDEELEDAQRGSAMPEGEGVDNEVDDDQPNSPPPATDNVENTPDISEVQTNAVLEPSTVEEDALEQGNDPPDIDELGFPIAGPSGGASGEILPTPAAAGPDLGAISRAHLLADAPGFNQTSSSVIQEDGIVADETIEFTV